LGNTLGIKRQTMKILVYKFIAFLKKLFKPKYKPEAPKEKTTGKKMYVINSYNFRALLLDYGFNPVQNPFPGQDTLKGLECYARTHETKGNRFFFIGLGKHFYVKEGTRLDTLKYVRLYPVIDKIQFERIINDFIPVKDWSELYWSKTGQNFA